MDDCVFCRIISGELPSMKVYEDDDTIAFMDIAADVDGHIVDAPKKHVVSILDCDCKTLESLIGTVKKLSDHLTGNCGYDGVNILNASGKSAGQSVPHFHMHLIPRKEGDGVDMWPHLKGAKREIREVFEEIRMI